MKAVVSLQISPKRKSLDAARLERFAQRALQAVKLTRGGIGVLITGSDQLQQLNRRFRGKNKPTDVLSFPAIPVAGGKYPYAHLGDIAISAPIAAQSAHSYGHSLEDEIKILMLHGILHLNGYDHHIDAGEMEAREAQLRRQLKLPISLIQRAKSQNLKPSRRKSPVRLGNR